MPMTYQQAQDILALSATHDGDPTPEMIEATNVMVKQSNINRINKQFLSRTDWVATKYTDEVIVNQTMTDADFKTKYADILAKRQAARAAIL